eukprot:381-Rhodomonas_salina.1
MSTPPRQQPCRTPSGLQGHNVETTPEKVNSAEQQVNSSNKESQSHAEHRSSEGAPARARGRVQPSASAAASTTRSVSRGHGGAGASGEREGGTWNAGSSHVAASKLKSSAPPPKREALLPKRE